MYDVNNGRMAESGDGEVDSRDKMPWGDPGDQEPGGLAAQCKAHYDFRLNLHWVAMLEVRPINPLPHGRHRRRREQCMATN